MVRHLRTRYTVHNTLSMHQHSTECSARRWHEEEVIIAAYRRSNYLLHQDGFASPMRRCVCMQPTHMSSIDRRRRFRLEFRYSV